METFVIEVQGEFSVNWPSGKGKEVGSIYGSAKSISGHLKQPFIFSDGHLFAFIALNEIGICLLHTETSAEGFFPNSLANVPRTFFETETFYSLLVDGDYFTKCFPVDELRFLAGEDRIDIFQEGQSDTY